jgi:hypothetical protein
MFQNDPNVPYRPSKRILLTYDFASYLEKNNREFWLKIFSDYETHNNEFGIEVFKIKKVDEEILGKYLLEFLKQIKYEIS